jgi:hypothetical protein
MVLTAVADVYYWYNAYLDLYIHQLNIFFEYGKFISLRMPNKRHLSLLFLANNIRLVIVYSENFIIR